METQSAAPQAEAASEPAEAAESVNQTELQFLVRNILEWVSVI
jgi:hypothetical protein